MITKLGTFDTSILDISDGIVEVLSTSGDTHLGGDDFDKVIVNYIADEFKKENGIDLRKDKQSFQRLFEAAEKTKCELSFKTTTEISLPFITADANGPKHLNMELSRSKFNQLTQHLIDRCLNPVKEALSMAKLQASEIDEVLLVGGSTRIPSVQDLVKNLTGKQPNMSVNPDEVVALGAAVQAGIINGEMKDIILLDVIPLSLGVETMGNIMTKLIERNTTIPCSKSETFSTGADNQPAVDIVVLQGERHFSKDNKTLGNFRLDGIRQAPRGVPQIEVTFDVDVNGILKVSAKDKDTNKVQNITISGSSNLDKSDIERMIEEAKLNEEKDKLKREIVENKNVLENYIYQIDKLLNDNENIDPSLKGQMMNVKEDIQKTLNNEELTLEEVKSKINEINNLVQTFMNRQQTQQSSDNNDVIDAEFENEAS